MVFIHIKWDESSWEWNLRLFSISQIAKLKTSAFSCVTSYLLEAFLLINIEEERVNTFYGGEYSVSKKFRALQTKFGKWSLNLPQATKLDAFAEFSLLPTWVSHDSQLAEQVTWTSSKASNLVLYCCFHMMHAKNI